MSIPSELKYTKDHEWVKVDGDVVTIGITDHAQDQLGDVVFVELPDVGTTMSAGDTFGTVESVKAVSDLFAPVGGEVTEVNEDLTETPEVVNSEPYGKAWMIKLKLADAAELEELMDAAAYGKLLEG
ncbi:MAG: glycine cleavage system protein GcvH [Myxococcota bacterium]